MTSSARPWAAPSNAGCNLARVLVEDKLITEEQFVSTIAEQLGLDFVDLADYPVDPAAARMVPETLSAALPRPSRSAGGRAG